MTCSPASESSWHVSAQQAAFCWRRGGPCANLLDVKDHSRLTAQPCGLGGGGEAAWWMVHGGCLPIVQPRRERLLIGISAILLRWCMHLTGVNVFAKSTV